MRCSRRLGIYALFVVASLLAGLGAGCLCDRGPVDGSMSDMTGMPAMSMPHCHVTEAGARIASACCCGGEAQLSAVAPLRTPVSAERPALGTDLPNAALFASQASPLDESRARAGWIDRAPPPVLASPLRI